MIEIPGTIKDFSFKIPLSESATYIKHLKESVKRCPSVDPWMDNFPVLYKKPTQVAFIFRVPGKYGECHGVIYPGTYRSLGFTIKEPSYFTIKKIRHYQGGTSLFKVFSSTGEETDAIYRFWHTGDLFNYKDFFYFSDRALAAYDPVDFIEQVTCFYITSRIHMAVWGKISAPAVPGSQLPSCMDFRMAENEIFDFVFPHFVWEDVIRNSISGEKDPVLKAFLQDNSSAVPLIDLYSNSYC
jgi:hypothetical protein